MFYIGVFLKTGVGEIHFGKHLSDFLTVQGPVIASDVAA